MKSCPECGATRFYATAFLAVTWMMDENGEFVKELDNYTIDAAPSEDGVWECAECGYSAYGYEFNCEE